MQVGKKTDNVGPLIGWSMTENDFRVFLKDEAHEFPAVCSVKVVSRGTKKNAAQLIDSLEEALNRKIEFYEFQIEKGSRNRFHSINFHLLLKSNDDFRRVYDVIRESQKVCYIL